MGHPLVTLGTLETGVKGPGRALVKAGISLPGAEAGDEGERHAVAAHGLHTQD